MGLKQPLRGDRADSKKGHHNLITDVPGVTVGHCTVKKDKLCTGVTAILPQQDNVFLHKLPAAAHVINGFGKSTGLVQIEELGTLESPILLTNTLSVPMVGHAMVKHMLNQNSDIGDSTGTVNTVVLECNDGSMNDIRALGVTEEHVQQALDTAGETFTEGDVGAGAGMICYDLKGGIGSASRVVTVGGKAYTIGCLVLSNFGYREDLIFCGVRLGKRFEAEQKNAEQGSIIVVLATDLPLSDRQLKRVCKRAGIGISRTGAFAGNGSGEIAVAFSTAQRLHHYAEERPFALCQLPDGALDVVFRNTASVVEESVLSSLYHASSATRRNGKRVLGLREAVQDLASKAPDEELLKLIGEYDL